MYSERTRRAETFLSQNLVSKVLRLRVVVDAIIKMIVNVQLEVTTTLEGDILETKYCDEKDSNRRALSGSIKH